MANQLIITSDFNVGAMVAAMLDNVIYPGDTILTLIINILANFVLGKVLFGEDINNIMESCCINLLNNRLSCL